MKPPTKFEIMRANRRLVENFQQKLRILETDREIRYRTLSAKDIAHLKVVDDMRDLMDKTLGIPTSRQQIMASRWPVCKVCGGDLKWTKGGTQGDCFVHGKQVAQVWP